MDGGEVFGAGIARLGVPHRLVPGLAGGAGKVGGAALRKQAVNELPDEPVSGFQPDLGGRICSWRVGEGFEHLGKEPFQPYEAAIAGEPWLVALAGDLVDAIGLGFGAMMFPEPGPGERRLCKPWNKTERRTVAEGREHRATGEIDADAADIPGRSAGLGHRLPAGVAHAVEPVLRMLQRIVGRKFSAAGGKFAVDDAMGVFVGCLAGDGSRADVDNQSANGFGAEVETD